MSGPARGYDCVVIGAGHNGLVCATYLARGGRRVLVLEAADVVGGAAITREFAPGFRVSACAHLLHMMPAALARDLGLAARGLTLAHASLPTVALDADGRHLGFAPGNVGGLAAAAPGDAAALEEWQALATRFAGALHPMLAATPPRLGVGGWRNARTLLDLGWAIRRLGRRDMRELLRIGGMCAYDLLEERFRAPLLQGALAADAVLGTNYGPRSPGTVATLLYRGATCGGAQSLALPVGGLGAVTAALARAASDAGAEIRTGAAVARVTVREDRVTGVALASGEEIAADAVISNADPKRTFLGLLGAEHLDAGFTRRVANLRTGGLAAKLHLALDALPAFTGLGAQSLGARLLVAPSHDYVERAFNHSKYGECSTAPMLEITVPSLLDPGLAPAGKHVMSVVAQYSPYAPAAGWERERQAYTDRIIDTLATYAPALRSTIVATELLTPADIEREFRITGGHWHHAELALDQFLMMRPVPGAGQYRTPVAGLYLCGAGSHPGGGVTGLAGRNAAREVLRGEDRR